jgi:sugar phosphate isomerase/epimerase
VGFTGSPLWGYVAGYPAPKPDVIDTALKRFAAQWHPILDAAGECGVRFACEVHPGQLAFDLYSAELVLDALGGREEFGFTFDPSHLHWQGVDPVEFLRRFPNRIYHVHVKDAQLTLNGRAGVLAGYWPSRRPPSRLAVPIPWARRDRLAGNRSGTERDRLRRPTGGRPGTTPGWTGNTGRPMPVGL